MVVFRKSKFSFSPPTGRPHSHKQRLRSPHAVVRNTRKAPGRTGNTEPSSLVSVDSNQGRAHTRGRKEKKSKKKGFFGRETLLPWESKNDVTPRCCDVHSASAANLATCGNTVSLFDKLQRDERLARRWSCLSHQSRGPCRSYRGATADVFRLPQPSSQGLEALVACCPVLHARVTEPQRTSTFYRTC